MWNNFHLHQLVDFMACDTITDILTQESGRFGPEIYDRIWATSPWIGLVKRGEWPDEMGDTINELMYERAAPTGSDYTDDWEALAIPDPDQEGGSCLPTPTKVVIGSTTKSYNLKRLVLEGPDFCVTDLRYKFQLRQQLEKILAILAGYSQLAWEQRYRQDYSANTGNKTVAALNWNNNGSSVDVPSGASYPIEAPVSILTQGMLNWARIKLLRNGAFLSALGKENGSAILTLICSAETSDRLIFDNADIRQDLRWGKPSELLQPYGVEKSYRGFYHLIDPYPRRFAAGTTDFVPANEVPPFVNTSATKGTKAIINPAWENAPYEESHIFDPEVFHSLIPKPITNPAPNFMFDPVTYLGDWRLKNILNRVCNPDGTIVYHRGTLGEAAQPVHNERGWSFVHLRCDPSGNLVTSCS